MKMLFDSFRVFSCIFLLLRPLICVCVRARVYVCVFFLHSIVLYVSRRQDTGDHASSSSSMPSLVLSLRSAVTHCLVSQMFSFWLYFPFVPLSFSVLIKFFVFPADCLKQSESCVLKRQNVRRVCGQFLTPLKHSSCVVSHDMITDRGCLFSTILINFLPSETSPRFS